MTLEAAAGAWSPDVAAIADFIRANLPLAPVPLSPELVLHRAHPGSGLHRLLDRADEPLPPYWAYPWPGGAVLARYVLDNPGTVSGKRVLDLGTGAGVVAIAAARAGARTVLAADIDAIAVVSAQLNAAANEVVLEVRHADMTAHAPPEVDLILGGDVFYAPDLAGRMSSYLERCRSAGIRVLIGDPGRAYLPSQRLALLEDYGISDFGGGATRRASVYAFDA